MWNKKKKCLLSFHDISIDNFDTISPLLEEIRLLASTPFALLIIPDPKSASSERFDAFKKQLKKWQQEGYELLLHGCSHFSIDSHRLSYQGRLAHILTHGEAEFAGLNQADSATLFKRALSFWNQLELEKPKAFVPPAWYDNPFLSSQVLKEGIVYEGRFLIQTKTLRHLSFAISFAGLLKPLIPIAFNYGHALLRIPFGVTRIALHPVDFPNHRERIHNLIRAALNESHWLQYKDL